MFSAGRQLVIAIMNAGAQSHSCAGQSAKLIPDSAYARMAAIFGNPTKGMRAASLGAVKFERDGAIEDLTPSRIN